MNARCSQVLTAVNVLELSQGRGGLSIRAVRVGAAASLVQLLRQCAGGVLLGGDVGSRCSDLRLRGVRVYIASNMVACGYGIIRVGS